MTSLSNLKDFNYSPEFRNRNVEILQAYLKTLGLRIIFDDEIYNIKVYSDIIDSFKNENGLYICTEAEYEDTVRELKLRKKYEDECCFVGSVDGFEKFVQEQLKEKEFRRKNYVIDIKI